MDGLALTPEERDLLERYFRAPDPAAVLASADDILLAMCYRLQGQEPARGRNLYYADLIAQQGPDDDTRRQDLLGLLAALAVQQTNYDVERRAGESVEQAIRRRGAQLQVDPQGATESFRDYALRVRVTDARTGRVLRMQAADQEGIGGGIARLAYQWLPGGDYAAGTDANWWQLDPAAYFRLPAGVPRDFAAVQQWVQFVGPLIGIGGLTPERWQQGYDPEFEPWVTVANTPDGRPVDVDTCTKVRNRLLQSRRLRQLLALPPPLLVSQQPPLPPPIPQYPVSYAGIEEEEPLRLPAPGEVLALPPARAVAPVPTPPSTPPPHVGGAVVLSPTPPPRRPRIVPPLALPGPVGAPRPPSTPRFRVFAPAPTAPPVGPALPALPGPTLAAPPAFDALPPTLQAETCPVCQSSCLPTGVLAAAVAHRDGFHAPLRDDRTPKQKDDAYAASLRVELQQFERSGQIPGDGLMATLRGVAPQYSDAAIAGFVEAWAADPRRVEFYFTRINNACASPICRPCLSRYAAEYGRFPLGVTEEGVPVTARLPYAALPYIEREPGGAIRPFNDPQANRIVSELLPFETGRPTTPAEVEARLAAAVPVVPYQVPWGWFDAYLGPYAIAPGALVLYREERPDEYYATPPSIGVIVEYDPEHLQPSLAQGQQLESLGFVRGSLGLLPMRAIVMPFCPYYGPSGRVSVPLDAVYPLAIDVPTRQAVLAARRGVSEAELRRVLPPDAALAQAAESVDAALAHIATLLVSPAVTATTRSRLDAVRRALNERRTAMAPCLNTERAAQLLRLIDREQRTPGSRLVAEFRQRGVDPLQGLSSMEVLARLYQQLGLPVPTNRAEIERTGLAEQLPSIDPADIAPGPSGRYEIQDAGQRLQIAYRVTAAQMASQGRPARAIVPPVFVLARNGRRLGATTPASIGLYDQMAGTWDGVFRAYGFPFPGAGAEPVPAVPDLIVDTLGEAEALIAQNPAWVAERALYDSWTRPYTWIEDSNGALYRSVQTALASPPPTPFVSPPPSRPTTPRVAVSPSRAATPTRAPPLRAGVGVLVENPVTGVIESALVPLPAGGMFPPPPSPPQTPAATALTRIRRGRETPLESLADALSQHLVFEVNFAVPVAAGSAPVVVRMYYIIVRPGPYRRGGVWDVPLLRLLRHFDEYPTDVPPWDAVMPRVSVVQQTLRDPRSRESLSPEQRALVSAVLLPDATPADLVLYVDDDITLTQAGEPLLYVLRPEAAERMLSERAPDLWDLIQSEAAGVEERSARRPRLQGEPSAGAMTIASPPPPSRALVPRTPPVSPRRPRAPSAPPAFVFAPPPLALPPPARALAVVTPPRAPSPFRPSSIVGELPPATPPIQRLLSPPPLLAEIYPAPPPTLPQPGDPGTELCSAARPHLPVEWLPQAQNWLTHLLRYTPAEGGVRGVAASSGAVVHALCLLAPRLAATPYAAMSAEEVLRRNRAFWNSWVLNPVLLLVPAAQ